MRKIHKKESIRLVQQFYDENKSSTKIRAINDVIFGMLLCLWSTEITSWLHENVGLSSAFQLLMIVAAVSYLILMAACRLKKFRLPCVGATLLFLGWIWLYRTNLIIGWQNWLKGLENAISDYYGIRWQLTTAHTMMSDDPLFGVTVTVILTALAGYVMIRWKKNWFTVMITILVFLMSLLLDHFPGIDRMILAFTSCGGLAAFTAESKIANGRKTGSLTIFKRVGSVTCAMLCMLCLSCWVAQHGVADEMHRHADFVQKYSQQMMTMSKQALKKWTGHQVGGLTNQPPVQSDRVELKIWASQKPKSAIYLKGFIGDSFNPDTECWATFTDEGLQEAYQHWENSKKWLYDEAKTLWTQQLYTYLQTMEDHVSECHYIVKNISANKGCAWAPYGVDASGFEIEGDNYLKASSDNEFNGYLLPDEPEILLGTSENYILNDNVQDLFLDYEGYVKANFLSVPDGMPSLEAAVAQIQAENGRLTTDQWIQQIQNVLWQTCTYEKMNLEAAPKDTNGIEYFFGSQKKGYCIHFASAGVMMLRMAGIPARYVEGYVAWADDFKADKDLKGYTADVTGYRGHAWIEVYDYAHGVWLPFDMTPSDSAQLENNPSTTEVVTTSEIPKNTDTTEQTATEIASSEIASNDGVSESDHPTVQTENTNLIGEGDKRNVSVMWRLIPIVAFVVIAIGLYYLYSYKQNKKNRPTYRRTNRNKALLMTWQQLTDALDDRGIKPEKELDDWNYIEWLQTQMPESKTDNLVFLMEKLYQAAYSDEDLTEEEYERCRVLCRDIQRYFKEKRS